MLRKPLPYQFTANAILLRGKLKCDIVDLGELLSGGLVILHLAIVNK
jgi:hypothetical protein